MPVPALAVTTGLAGVAVCAGRSTKVSGDAEQWSLELVPRDLRLRGQVASVRVSGRESMAREVRVLLADGDQSVMTIEPVAVGRGTP